MHSPDLHVIANALMAHIRGIDNRTRFSLTPKTFLDDGDGYLLTVYYRRRFCDTVYDTAYEIRISYNSIVIYYGIRTENVFYANPKFLDDITTHHQRITASF
jgi:hypothetical protein